MKVKVNGKPVDTPGGQMRTVGGLLDILRRRGYVPAGEVVSQLDADGHTWRTQDWEGLLDTSLEHVEELAVETADTYSCARLVLKDVEAMLSVLTEGAQAAAESFRNDSVEKANRNLFLLFDAVQNFLSCLYQVHKTCDLPNTITAGGSDVLQRLNSTLEGMEDAQRRGDWQVLVQKLEGELMPMLEEFFDVIDRLAAEVDRVARV